MDPFTVALATFGVQKLRGKSTKRALRDAAIFAGGTQLAGMAGVGSTVGPNMGAFAPQAFGSVGANTVAFGDTMIGGGLQSLVGKSGVAEKELLKDSTGKVIQEAAPAVKGKGFLGMGTFGKLATAGSLLPLLVGEDEPEKPLWLQKKIIEKHTKNSLLN